METRLLKIFSFLYFVLGGLSLITGVAGAFFVVQIIPVPLIWISFLVKSSVTIDGPPSPWYVIYLIYGTSVLAVILGLLGAYAADWLKNNERRGIIVWGILVLFALASGISNIFYIKNESDLYSVGVRSLFISIFITFLFWLAYRKAKLNTAKYV